MDNPCQHFYTRLVLNLNEEGGTSGDLHHSQPSSIQFVTLAIMHCIGLSLQKDRNFFTHFFGEKFKGPSSIHKLATSVVKLSLQLVERNKDKEL